MIIYGFVLPQLIIKPVPYTHAVSQKSISPTSSQSVEVFDVPVTIAHFTDNEDEDVMETFAMSPSPEEESIVQAPPLFGESGCVQEATTVCLNPPVASTPSECTSFQTASQPLEFCPMKVELEGLVGKHHEKMVHLTASLTKENVDTLLTMDSKGLVEALFEAIEDDYRKNYGVPICVKKLWKYLYKKGYRDIALELLQCSEDMED